MVGPNGAEAMEYDKNGNLTRLNRQGRKTNNTWGTIDGLVYSYSSTTSNRISGIWDTSSEVASFTDRTNQAEYSYWPDGSLKSDASKEITLIEYNYLKRPRRITFVGGQTIEYEYDGAGTKLRQKDRSGTWTEYVGNQLWRGSLLVQVAHEEGRISNTGTAAAPVYRYEWGLTDHLGNLRVAFRDSSGVAAPVQWEAFGPWGESLPTLTGVCSNPSANPYVFTGHERMSELGVYDAKARVYDQWVPRFWQIDPLADKYYNTSPFEYATNNPLRFIDPDGRDIVIYAAPLKPYHFIE
jgi:RHS repeat-associated protein